jgi:hypothetical protein
MASCGLIGSSALTLLDDGNAMTFMHGENRHGGDAGKAYWDGREAHAAARVLR